MNRKNLLSFLSTFVLFLMMAVLFCGCGEVAEIGSDIAAAGGVITSSQADSITRSTKAVEKSQQELTPEQEYYVGRAVVASVLKTYQPLDRAQPNTYLNLLGQSLAIFSNLPETFGGYHFLLLDSDEINAFAAPGGLILVTRGMLQCCNNEDELAAVLASC
jgi:predicted Zn-dependent protease